MSRSPFILRRYSTHATAAHTFIRYSIARYFPISKLENNKTKQKQNVIAFDS